MSKYAAVFPGQGSQSIGMLADLASEHPEVEQTFQEASDVLSRDLWAMAQEGPDTALNATTNTQPVMLAAGVAVWRVWEKLGGCKPEIMAGHSLGEYTALVCAGALDFAEAAALVAERAAHMQGAVAEGQGAMAAILGLDDATVIDVCERAAEGQVVAAVNFNSPGQVVIAGEAEAVDRAIELAKAAGAKRAIKLAVSVPSHCELMRPAADGLAMFLESTALRPPAIPVLHNVDVSSYDDVAAIRQALLSQLYQPVRWVETVQAFKARGIDRLIEFGPGKVLTGLTRRIDKSLSGLGVFDPASLEKALDVCNGEQQ
jgi:[acyl-carrier-protein] S-malonyltransferase